MNDTVEALSRKIDYKEKEYVAPKNGLFRIAQLNEFAVDSLALYGSSIEKDLNRDGNPKDQVVYLLLFGIKNQIMYG